MDKNLTSLNKTARLAGILYLLMALIAPFGLIYVPTQIFVSGDATATAENILTNEFLFRSGVVSSLVTQVIFVFLVIVLYRLLKHVNLQQARVMVGLVIVSIPISFFSDVFKITGLMVLKGGLLTSLEPEQVIDFAGILFKTGSYGLQTVELYWGLWLLPFGLLVYKSEFIPRMFGILLFLNGLAYIILSFTFVLFPTHHELVSKITLPFLFIGELPIILWFLIKGTRVKQDIGDN